MYKGSSRNRQRIGIKVTAGTAPGKEANDLAAPVKQIRFAEALRLARIRRIFEIEQKLKSADGAEGRKLREELEGVRSGRIDPPVTLARDPRPKSDRPRAVTVAERQGPARIPAGRSTIDPKRAAKGLEADLSDLARGKTTLTGFSLVKTLLANFDALTIAAAIGAKLDTIEKIAGHALVRLAPTLSSEEGLILVGILEDRLEAAMNADSTDVPDDDPVEPPGPRF